MPALLTLIGQPVRPQRHEFWKCRQRKSAVQGKRLIHVGDTYNDLGAAILSPDADKNLGVKTFLNGKLVSNIVIDTTQVATDRIDYVVTDPAGLAATSTRIVLVEASDTAPESTGSLPVLDPAPPLAPDYTATTTYQ